MSKDDGTCNRDYWDQQYPGVFLPIPKSQRSLAQPTPRKAKKPLPTMPLAPPRREGDAIVITLPLPPAKLQANRKNNRNWQETHRLAKAMRFACGLMAKQAAPPQPFKRARLDITTWTTKKVDPANVWQWCKSAIDALQDSGCIGNDRDLECGEIVGYYGKATNGRRDMEFRITDLTHLENDP